jgi:tetratricopeptide (TPR) repeat protein
MVFGDWFKGKAKQPPPPKPAVIRRPDELVTVYDERGRELQIKRSDWVANVLAPALEKAWNDPRELNAQIVHALRDEFVDQVADAAEHLLAIDNESLDALIIAAVVRMERGDLDGADAALQRATAKHGESGVVLTNAAKVLDRRGNKAQARATLRRALDLDPNQENGLLWWAAQAREERGEAAYTAALKEIAAVKDAWRPQLWLARRMLSSGDRDGALAAYEHVLAHAADVPDVLMQVTGDLGNASALEDLLRVGAGRYKPEVHGPHAGLNIVQAYRQLGRTDEARALVRRLQGMGWAPLAASLAQLEGEIAAGALPKADAAVPEVGAMTLDSPIWTRGLYEPDWMWPPPASDDEPVICLSTFANEMLSGDGPPEIQAVNDFGRLTRALPIYLAEVFRVRFRARARASLWIVKNGGPAIMGKQLNREILESAAPTSGSRRIVVAGSLVASGVQLQIWEIGSPEAPATISIEVALTDVGGVLVGVEGVLTAALRERGLLSEQRPPSFYDPPPADRLLHYVSALEQLLYQLLAANELVRPDSLWNERGFFETYFGLVEAWRNPPESARLVAICGTVAAAKYGSTILDPYRKIVLQWIDEAPPRSVISLLAPAILKRLGEQGRYQRSLQPPPTLPDPRYPPWLERVKTNA